MSSALPPGSVVLVTGINGYIGSHVADQLLEAGFNVRGTVRDVKKVGGLLQLWENKFGKDKVELVVVKDFSTPGAFDVAVQGIAGIAHVASNVTFNPDPNVVIPDVVSSIHEILDSAAKTPTVKSLVYTSSAAALAPPTPNVARRLGPETYNEEDVKMAWAPPPYLPDRAMSVYAASKAEGEKALFAYSKEKQPHFTINSIVLGVNFGKVLDWSIPVSSGSFVKEILNGQPERAKHLDYQWFVDVQDSARLHVGALIDPAINNERIISYATHFTWNDLLDHLRKIRPDHEWVDNFTDGTIKDLSQISNERGTALLKAMGRHGWTSVEESLRLNLEGL